MNKQELRNGMVVKTRGGTTYIVVGDKFLRYDGFMRITDYNVDLTLNHSTLYGFDIMKVYAEVEALKELDDNTKVLIWERI